MAVVGAGWTGLATATFLQEMGHDVVVHEAGDRPGGRVSTLRADGWLVEAGPHAVVPADPATRRLLDLAKVPLETAPPGAPRFVVHDGRAHALPAKPPDILRTRLLGAGAKARLLTEPFRGAGPAGETVAAFARRRLGPSVAPLVDAFVTGVYAGDPERLVLAHAFPDLHRMDQGGGLLRSLRRPAAPRPPLTAPRDGMDALLRALADRLDVSYRSPVTRVVEEEGGVALETPRGTLRVDRVVFAAGPVAVKRALGLAAASPPLASVHVVAFGLPDDAAPPEGYGVLVPEREGRFALGALYESRLFPGRAPPGHALLRCLIGGRRHPERAALPHDEIARRAWQDLRALGLVRGEPSRTFHLPTAGIPQPEAGHDAWLAALPRGRVRVAGIGHQAVGLNALAAHAHRLAKEWA